MDYLSVFAELGLSKNESQVFMTLLESGESTVGQISRTSGIHRRNIYDVLNRLLEKGLVFEIVESKSRFFKAVDPNKLSELIQEQELVLKSALPGLRKLHETSPEKQQALIYRGVEGLKNYMRDILRIGEDVYVIGAKGIWLDPRIESFLPWFFTEAEHKGIKYYHLFDHEVVDKAPAILEKILHYKVLPPKYSTKVTVDFFGDHVNLISPVTPKKLEDEFSVTVIIDRRLANSFRLWFDYMWKNAEAVGM